jgi:hypothetical protein
MFNKIGDLLIAIVFVAAIFVMVRPKSQGPTLVDSITGGLTNLLKAATGGGTWSG